MISFTVIAFMGLSNIGAHMDSDSDWKPLGYVEKLVNVGGSRAVVSIEAYEAHADQEELLNAMKSLAKYCEDWNRENSPGAPRCGLDPKLLEEYAREDKLAVVVVVVRVVNSGSVPVTIGGPGPYCGYSYNLDHLKDPTLEPLKQHYKPVSYLYYKVKSGKNVLGYGGFCQLALILHTLYPGDELKTTYGFIVVRPAEIAFAVDPMIMFGSEEAFVELNATIKVP